MGQQPALDVRLPCETVEALRTYPFVTASSIDDTVQELRASVSGKHQVRARWTRAGGQFSLGPLAAVNQDMFRALMGRVGGLLGFGNRFSVPFVGELLT